MTPINTTSSREDAEKMNNLFDVSSFIKKWINEYIEQQSHKSSDRAFLLQCLHADIPRGKLLNLLKQYVIKQTEQYNKVNKTKQLSIDVTLKQLQASPNDIVSAIMRIVFVRQQQELQLARIIQSKFIFNPPASTTDIRKFLETVSSKELKQAKEKHAMLKLLLEVKGKFVIEDYKIADVFRELGIDSKRVSTSDQQAIRIFLSTGNLDIEVLDRLIGSMTSNIAARKKTVKFFLSKVSLKRLQEYKIISKIEAEEYTNQVFLKFLSLNAINKFGSVNEFLFDPTISEDEQQHRRSMYQYFLYTFSFYDDAIFPDTMLADSHIDAIFSNAVFSHLVEEETGEPVVAGAPHDEEHIDIESIENFEMVQQYIINHLSTSDAGKIRFSWDDFIVGSFLISERPGGIKKYWKLETVNEVSPTNGMVGLRLRGFSSTGKDAGVASIDYTTFINQFIEEVQITDTVTIDTDVEFLDESEILGTVDDFYEAFDMIDQKNAGKHLLPGTSLCVLTNKKEIEYLRIIDFSGSPQCIISLQGQDGIVIPSIPWITFLSLMSDRAAIASCERYANISNSQRFLRNTSIVGITENNGKWTCGEDPKTKKDIPFWGLKSSQGKSYIQIIPGNDSVEIFHYNVEGTNITRTQEGSSAMPYEFLQGYLESNNFTIPISHDPSKEQKKDDTTNMPKINAQGMLGKLIAMRNVRDISGSIKMGFSMIEHKLKESHELHAADTLYNTFLSIFGPEHPWTLSAMGTFTGKVSELINQKMASLNNMKGPVQQKAILGILSAKTPDKLSIIAAMLIMAENEGKLYPEPILGSYQGEEYVWFRQLTTALGYNYQEELKIAEEKAKEANPTIADHMDETILITNFLKRYSDKNPYIQAMNGGSRFWNKLPEGRQNKKNKGSNEVKEFQGSESREKYVMGKFESNELDVVVGSFPELCNASTDPATLTPAFIWTMGTATNIAHPDLSQDFFKNFVGTGISFHALAFSSQKKDAMVYQNMLSVIVPILVQQNRLPNSAIDDINAINTARHNNPYGHNKVIIPLIRNFWKQHHSVLHGVLQGTDPTAFMALQDPDINGSDKTTITQYYRILDMMTGAGSLGGKQPNLDVMSGGGYALDGGSMIFDMHEEKYFSIKRLLNYISIDGHTGRIYDEGIRVHIWEGQIIPYLREIRSNALFIENETFQREQFKIIYYEILSFLRSSFAGMSEAQYNRAINGQTYLQVLQDEFNFNLEFSTLFPNDMGHKSNEISDSSICDDVTNRFVAGVTTTAQRGWEEIQSRIQGGVHRAVVLGSNESFES